MIEKIKQNWQTILEKMKSDYGITGPAYNTFVAPLYVLSVKDSTIYISVPDKLKNLIEHVTLKYSTYLTVAINEVMQEEFGGEEYTVSIVPPDTVIEVPKAAAPKTAPLPEHVSNSNLNPRYTFDTFVVGKNNELAHATALAVAEDPGNYGNPLFIYGGVGLGKTHLMHAIAYYILSQRPNQKILYVTSEEFTNELVRAIKTNKNEEFRNKYRSLDVLLIDDIQFIANRESTQEEFFHTFNTLRDNNKQIILTSDKVPRELQNLPDRLISRFQNGLIVDVQAPDYETRMAILNKRAELDCIDISQDCMHYIAENIKSNIRQLEGALSQIKNLAKLKHVPIDMEIVQEALANIISPDVQMPVTMDSIINIVAEHYNITVDDLKGSKKTRDLSHPRQVCMYLCCKMTDNSQQAIGKALCRNDHTTVRHGIKKIENDIQTDESLKNTIDILIKKINPPKK